MSEDDVATISSIGNSDRVRLDGWQNLLTGIGSDIFDKRNQSFHQTIAVSNEEARDLWRGDDVAARVIETIPKEMFRQGFELKLDNKKQAEKVDNYLKELSFHKSYIRAKKFERAYGGSAIFPVLNDGQSELSLPLNLDRIVKLSHFQVFEPRELIPIRWYDDPRNPKFGTPQIYRVNPVHTGGGPSMRTQLSIHETRLIRFEGIQVSREQSPDTLQGWGDSILTRMKIVLRDFNMTWGSAGILVQDFSQAIFRMKGLAELVATNRSEIVKLRMRAIEMSRSTARAILLDENEEFERKSTNLTGLPDLLDKFATRLAAAAGMPLTMLMGMSPGGLNATGESDITLFYDQVAGHQEETLPQVTRGLEICMRCRTGPLGGTLPKVWSAEFLPLMQQTDQEIVTLRSTQAQTDKIYVDMGALSPEEIAVNRFGGDTYSYETRIDFEARERQEPEADSPAKTDQQLEEEAKLEKHESAKIEAMRKTPPANDKGAVKEDALPFGEEEVLYARFDAFATNQPRDKLGRWSPTGHSADKHVDKASGLYHELKSNAGRSVAHQGLADTAKKHVANVYQLGILAQGGDKAAEKALRAARRKIEAAHEEYTKLSPEPAAESWKGGPEFAAKAMHAASSVDQTGRFGPDKVFIDAAYREAQKQGFDGVRDDFKRELLSAHQAGTMTLSRADLVEAMDPDLVRRSKTSIGVADFHFIRTSTATQPIESKKPHFQILSSKTLVRSMSEKVKVGDHTLLFRLRGAPGKGFAPSDGVVRVQVTEKGKHVGAVAFGPGLNGGMIATWVEVKPEYRRLGIASHMYALSERLSGLKVEKAVTQTDMGKAFNASFRERSK